MVTHQWSVMITDWMLAGYAAWLCVLMRRHAVAAKETSRYVAAAFVACALAAFDGGVRHGFGVWCTSFTYSVFWYVSYALILPGSTILACGVLRGFARDADYRQISQLLIGFKFLLAAELFLTSGDIQWIAANWGVDMSAIASVGIAAAFSWWGSRAGQWLLTGVAIGVFGGVIQHGWIVGTDGMLHDNLFHLIQIPALYCFYRATFFLYERRTQQQPH